MGWLERSANRKMNGTNPLVGKGEGDVCVFPSGANKPTWVLEQCVWPVIQDEDHNAPSASGDDSGNNNRIMGDGVSSEKSPLLMSVSKNSPLFPSLFASNVTVGTVLA